MTGISLYGMQSLEVTGYLYSRQPVLIYQAILTGEKLS
jgi:hypothetical protein